MMSSEIPKGKVLLFLKGLQGSGKSFFAKALVKEQPDRWCRVNKDSLRDMLHDGIYSRGREDVVKLMQRRLAEQALLADMSVIVDDTNLAGTHEVFYRQLAQMNGAAFIVKEFDTSVEECIERDLQRPKPVGKDVILKTYYQSLRDVKKPEHVPGLPNAVIVDLDGTLTVVKDRGFFEWDKVGNDELNKPVAMTVNSLADNHARPRVLLVSGRDECCREATLKWLNVNGIDPHALYMRPAGSKEKDTIVKRRIYEDHIKGRYNVLCVFDDRPSVVRMWRALGLFVFDCGFGVEF